MVCGLGSKDQEFTKEVFTSVVILLRTDLIYLESS